MEGNGDKIPSEITRFMISKNSLKEIVGDKIGEKVKSMELKDDSLEITIPDSLLRTIVGNRYSKEIKSVKITNNEAEIKVGTT